MTALSALLFALYFVLAKFVYLSQPFISGFIWTRIGAFLIAMTFLLTREVREEIFRKRETFKVKTLGILIPNQTLGAGAALLQNWAVSLVPLGFLAFISALEGTRYIFLLIFTIFLSLKFPRILKEEISRQVLFQKNYRYYINWKWIGFISIKIRQYIWSDRRIYITYLC